MKEDLRGKIKGICKEKEEQLIKAGIKDLKTLAESDVGSISKATGIKTDFLRYWRRMAKLQRVKGVDKELSYFLLSKGIRNLKDLLLLNPNVVDERMEVRDLIAKVQREAFQYASNMLIDELRTTDEKSLLKIIKRADQKDIEIYNEICLRILNEKSAKSIHSVFRQKTTSPILRQLASRASKSFKWRKEDLESIHERIQHLNESDIKEIRKLANLLRSKVQAGGS